MADHQTEIPDPPQPAHLSLKAFTASLYHAERADNYFKLLNNLSEEVLATFLQGLERQMGDAIDDNNMNELTGFVQR